MMSVMMILLLSLLAACSSGIPQEQYDSIRAKLADAQTEATELQDKVAGLQAEVADLKGQKEAAESQVQAAQAQVAGLTGKVSEIKEENELVGDTPAETAENIVRQYHETHTYSKIDFFVCWDMAMDVWNMLKTHEIDAVIAVGNKDTAISDIVQCNHAWVLAEVSPGENLALETTGGFVVPKSENELYYKGWSFATPSDFKKYNRLFEEYNVRVDIRNKLASEINAAAEEYNAAVDEWNEKYAGDSSSTGAQVHNARMEEIEKKQDLLTEITREQEAEMNGIMFEINGLAAEIR